MDSLSEFLRLVRDRSGFLHAELSAPGAIVRHPRMLAEA